MEKSNVKIHSAITKIAKFGGITEGAAVADLVAPTSRRKVEVCPPIDGNLGPQDSANGPALVNSLFWLMVQNQYTRKVGDSPLLREICEVVEYSLSLPPGSARQKLCRAKYPSLLRSDTLSN